MSCSLILKDSVKSIGILFGLCVGMFLPLKGDTPHLTASKQAGALILHYSLVDLGACDLSADALTRQSDHLSQGPLINEHGDIVGNRSSGGFVILGNRGEYVPEIQNARLNFYGINNHRDLLISIARDPKTVEWYIWPAGQGWTGRRIPIDPVELEGNKIQLSKINDQQYVIGNARPDNRSMPLEWHPDFGLYRLGHGQSEDVLGFVKDINERGTIVGKSHRHLEAFPFVRLNNVLLSMFPLRCQFNPPSDAKIIFEDLLIGPDDTVYGTYWLDKNFDNPSAVATRELRGFKWSPVEGAMTLIDFDGMRISAVNSSNRFVGSHHGKACFRDMDFKPIDLASSMRKEEWEGWTLLEATGINDDGQIVGFGKKGDAMHLFLANPL